MILTGALEVTMTGGKEYNMSDWSDRIFSWDFMSHVQLESLLLPSPRSCT